MMPCQIKETQAAASHKAEYNNAAGGTLLLSLACRQHSGEQNPSATRNQAKPSALRGQYALSNLHAGRSNILGKSLSFHLSTTGFVGLCPSLAASGPEVNLRKCCTIYCFSIDTATCAKVTSQDEQCQVKQIHSNT